LIETFVESSVETFAGSSVGNFVESSVETFVESSVETFAGSSVGARCVTHLLINHPFLDMSPISGFVLNLVLNLHQDLALDLCTGCILHFTSAGTVHLYQKFYSI